MKKLVSTFIVFYALWLLLAGIATSELILGAVVSLALAILVFKMVNYSFGPIVVVQGLKYVVLFIPLFIWKLILANLHVARIVLSKKLPIKPGFVVVKTSLKKDISKLSLANAITMTPGTLSIDVADDEILIHWITVNEGTASDHRNEISKDFEKQLGGIFE